MLQKAYSHWRGILMSYIRQFCIIVKSSLSGVRLLAETLALIFHVIWHGLIINLLVLISSDDVCACMLSYVQLLATPWTISNHFPLSMEFFRQEYWNGLSFPMSGALTDPGIKPASLVSPALRQIFYHHATWKA